MPLKQYWINSLNADLAFIIAPPFISLLAVIMFPEHFQQASGIPTIYWVILILLIDVAHVYTTLYQTYFNPSRLKQHQSLYLAIPALCYITGVLLHTIDSMLFWRILAYLAVYHFVKQQYGFMRLYSRHEELPSWSKKIDVLIIYSSTLYPILYWHLTDDRNFNWFIEDEFFTFQSDLLLTLISSLYIVIISIYVAKELYRSILHKQINLPKNLIILGTGLSWYFGIVHYNGDMAFTTLNVVSHGIPYMALVWFRQKKENPVYKSPLLQKLKSPYGLFVFFGIIAVLAYLEEGLWDGFIWREHKSVFGIFSLLPEISSKEMLALLVPLLSLPQSTHYVLDGFIWKQGH
ncbi:hypothetical protein [Solitalea lacus]|uniref:hypothetical protein n=1 Tax=Solitalea lacus TaxID=2911172 RepID=UPI001ED9D04E|nr:hypothetical protein [Solitalea lacus]UKJ06490.1 hypothetical protein L2B55_13215 [Solitalea lacus]